MEEKERFEIHIYDDVCVDLYNNGVLDKSINDTYKLEKLLNQQDKRIRDLEAKLAESEKKYAELFCRNIELETLYSQKTARLNFYKDTDLVEENKQLKQQLAEKEKIEYTDTINFVETSEPDIVAKELDRLNEQLAEKEKKIEQLKKFDDLNRNFFALFRTAFKVPNKVDDLFNTLKTTQEKHNQDKISFCIEQLEKVKEKILSYENVYYQFLESGAKVPVVCLENFRVKQTIDNQIKELKGEK